MYKKTGRVGFRILIMKYLREWAKGKPLGLVMIPQQFAIGAESCFEFLKLIKAG